MRSLMHSLRAPRRIFSSSASRAGDSDVPYAFIEPEFTRLKGISVVHDPWSNKGTGFPIPERDRMNIRGLVPPRTLTLPVQAVKVKSAIDSRTDALEKHSFLADLQDRNEVLYFRLLIDNLEEFAPIVYTPTVGRACVRFGSIFRRARGMYFSSQDVGQCAAMVQNWPHDDVEIIVVTDGSRILGLGDLGANGMGIPIGKLALYVAAGGINPRKVLPVMLDLGTDNKTLQQDPWYLGLPEPRLRGPAYYNMVDEFVHAVAGRWPHALIQFEDFSSDKAANILDTYRHTNLCFNDDIQGTGAVTLGALLAAVRTQGNDAKLGDQRIVIMGAGSAGMGVAASLAQAMMTREGLSAEAAAARFWVLDKDGLMTSARPEASFSAVQKTFARPIAKAGGRAGALCDGAGLTDVVRAVQPTILLGFTGVGGAFPEAAVRAMAAHCARPIIFPLSNPTANAECTAQQAYEWTDGKAVFGGGSPFDAVTIKGVTIEPSQINNMFMFPGMGLCSVAVRPRRITDSMFQAAAVAMASMVTPADLALGRVVPRVRDIRAVSAKVAAAAAQQAMHEGIVNKMPPAGDLTKFMEKIMYDPIYRPLVCNPRG